MQFRPVQRITPAQDINMGGTHIKQPLPTQLVPDVDPFLLLHHFGPFNVEPGQDPLDVGPHPHRGFEPVTFLYSGGIRHRDSRGNTGHLSGGDVQWMTAGMGIIHSERASEEFLEKGGTMEGIQLWVNLPKAQKMVQPRYQDIKADAIPKWTSSDDKAQLRIVAGEFGNLSGAADTYSPINAWQLSLQANGKIDIPFPSTHQALIYILKGEIQVNDGYEYGPHHMLTFDTEGEGIRLEGKAGESEILILTGEAHQEPVAQYGPFVMNTQTEIMEAMRDYQMGKMGFYTEY